MLKAVALLPGTGSESELTKCSPWTPEKNGTIISSGDNSHHISKNNKRTQSTLLTRTAT